MDIDFKKVEIETVAEAELDAIVGGLLDDPVIVTAVI